MLNNKDVFPALSQVFQNAFLWFFSDSSSRIAFPNSIHSLPSHNLLVLVDVY